MEPPQLFEVTPPEWASAFGLGRFYAGVAEHNRGADIIRRHWGPSALSSAFAASASGTGTGRGQTQEVATDRFAFTADGYFVLHCRDNTIGRRSGGMLRWDYPPSQVLHVVRPPDGAPPEDGEVRCSQCGEIVRLRVPSVEAAKARLRLLQLAPLLSLAVFVLGVVLFWVFIGPADRASLDGESDSGATAMVVTGIALCALGIGSVGALLNASGNYFAVARTIPFLIVKHPIVPARERG